MIFKIFVCFLIATESFATSNRENLELKTVHILFRHGERTPDKTYPTDIHINETFAPYGRGKLTNFGKQQMFELGEYLRLRYNSFLGGRLNLDDLHIQSTVVDRSKISLQLVLAGLFPPKNTELEWNVNLNWQPIPFSYDPIQTDMLLMYKPPCPRYYEELERVIDEDLKDVFENYSQMFKELSTITGWNITSADQIQTLFVSLKAEKDFGLKLPTWTAKYFPEKLQDLNEKNFIFKFYNSELKRLKGGVFVKKAINHWKRKISNELKEKFFLYSGHDVTISMILLAFNVWEQQYPSYGSIAMFELSQHRETREYGVEIFLRNSTNTAPHQLTIPGCESFCLLSELENLLKENMPMDWEAECRAKNENFVVSKFFDL